MRKFTILINTIIFIGVSSFFGCDENENLVLFSIQNDKDLGLQVSQEIANDPSFVLLSETEHKESYDYLDGMVAEILNSGDVKYRNEFAWEVTIVQNDDVLNAFATPGGYIYVYTGLIKYLGQNEANAADALAGVLGHEIAHADLRHTSRNLQKQYGVSVLLSVVLGDGGSELKDIAGQVAGKVAGLKFSREFESESDDRSVEYLANTKYACDGAKIFFEALQDQGQASPPEFLSTHPSPATRVTDITAKASEVGCETKLSGDVAGYNAFVASLPE